MARKGKQAAPEPSEATEQATEQATEPSGVGGAARASASVPPFTASFPRDAELDVLVAAFVRGDYRQVRDGAPDLARRAEDPEVRRAALELRARIDPDPLGRALIALAAGLLLVLAYFYLGHGHGPP